MTLNIDLEEVPFAILEAVKARILANRRRLQQDQQRPRPSLRPKPQSIKQGASSKGWRLPKQAAMVLEESGRVLLVTWNGIQPVLSDVDAVRLVQIISPSSVSTTITAGATVPAHGVPGALYSFWRYRIVNSRITGTSDFTLEAWVQLTRSRSSAVEIQLESSSEVGVGLEYVYVSGVDIAAGSYFVFLDPIDGLSNLNSGGGSRLFDPQHLCIMRKDGNFYWAIDGFIYAVNSSPQGRAYSMTGHDAFVFNVYSGGNQTPNKLGPIRLDPDRARYSINGFTPDPLPFTE